MDPTAAGGFSQEQFVEACAELQQPALAGANRQLLVETLGIYRLLDQKTGLYEYKVFGVLEDCPPALFTEVYIYMDLEDRKKWDQLVKELYEKECGDKTVVHCEVKYPFPCPTGLTSTPGSGESWMGTDRSAWSWPRAPPRRVLLRSRA
uniref:Uncharacterized protein n=1 Tax=Molossus molossus TaxID=27622 RepID=A0A7J8JY93_MOLMO|nr:hypothetical protein HJG59_008073 [Molossus molossus]